MAVKDPAELLQELEAARGALSRAEAAVVRELTESPGMTVRELAERSSVSEAAVVAFAETAGELLGEKTMDARDGSGVAAAAGKAASARPDLMRDASPDPTPRQLQRRAQSVLAARPDGPRPP